ncbi:MAG: tetratricopeptide repeat protein [Elusimicrobiota bacterium]
MKKYLFLAFLLFAAPVRAAEQIQINPDKGKYPGAVEEPVPAIRPSPESSAETGPVPGEEVPPDAAPAGAVYEDPRLAEAETALNAGDWSAAREKARAVIRERRKSSQAWTLFGRSFYAQKRYKKAVRRFRKALKYDAHNAQAYYWAGRSFEAMGKLDEAVNEYQAAFRADPRLASAKEAWKRLRGRAEEEAVE